MTGDMLGACKYNGLCYTYLLETGSANETSVRVAHCLSVSSENFGVCACVCVFFDRAQRYGVVSGCGE